MERTLVAFTITLLAPAFAHAAHPRQQLRTDNTAHEREFVSARPDSRGHVFARQVLAASGRDPTQKAASRVIYLNHDGVMLTPGSNDARLHRSSIVTEPVSISAWDVDDDTWQDTVACVREIYAPFDVSITDIDPGEVPHLEAVFGGHPNDVGLPDNVAGVSPFTTDCSIIESSIVFTFTDVLPDDPRLMCEVMAQEIAHSYGLDHQLLPSDPMTYLPYDGERTFQNEMATCGELVGRDCGINGSVCRDGQNSVALLTNRLGRHGADPASPEDITTEPEVGGCAASGSGGPLAVGALGVLLAFRRRRSPG